tara:strand:- start:427 stop:804 length:378 start_codon:yes stop_codon:yes gene_type:complete
MPLIKATLKLQMQQGIKNDPLFKAELFRISKKAMDRFQTAQKQALINAGTGVAFAAAQKVASLAFANELQKIQGPIGDAVAKHVSSAVDNYVKLGQVIIPVPLTSTPAAIGAPVVIPVVPPGKLI